MFGFFKILPSKKMRDDECIYAASIYTKKRHSFMQHFNTYAGTRYPTIVCLLIKIIVKSNDFMADF